MYSATIFLICLCNFCALAVVGFPSIAFFIYGTITACSNKKNFNLCSFFFNVQKENFQNYLKSALSPQSALNPTYLIRISFANGHTKSLRSDGAAPRPTESLPPSHQTHHAHHESAPSHSSSVCSALAR